MLLNTKHTFGFSLQLLSETFPILRRTEQVIIINVYWSSQKVALILVRFNMNFADRLLKNTQVSNFTKIHPVGAKLFHVNRQTTTKLTVIFHNFANRPKINNHVRFQGSATVQLRPSVFRDVTQWLQTAYQSHLQGSTYN
jgi:hypothetical protein